MSDEDDVGGSFLQKAMFESEDQGQEVSNGNILKQVEKDKNKKDQLVNSKKLSYVVIPKESPVLAKNTSKTLLQAPPPQSNVLLYISTGDLSKSTRQSIQAVNSFAEAASRLQELQKQLQTKDKLIKSLNTMIINQITFKTKSISAPNCERTLYNQRIEQLKAKQPQIESLTQSLSDQMNENSKLEDENRDYQQKLNKMNLKYQILLSKLSIFKQNPNKLNQFQLKNLEIEYLEKLRQEEDLLKTHKELQNKFTEYKTQLDSSKSQIQALKLERVKLNSELQKAHKAYQSELQSTQISRDQYKQAILSYNDTIGKKQQQTQSLMEQIYKLEKYNAEIQDQFAASQKQLMESKLAFKKKEQLTNMNKWQIQQYEKKIQKLNEQIAARDKVLQVVEAARRDQVNTLSQRIKQLQEDLTTSYIRETAKIAISEARPPKQLSNLLTTQRNLLETMRFINCKFYANAPQRIKNILLQIMCILIKYFKEICKTKGLKSFKHISQIDSHGDLTAIFTQIYQAFRQQLVLEIIKTEIRI